MGERWYREQLRTKSRSTSCPSENFGNTSNVLRTAGFIPIPLKGKKPIPKGWSDFWKHTPSEKTYEVWRTKNTDANVGLCLGEMIAIDIDHDEQAAADAAQALAFSTLGATPFIRIGRAPRRTCFYRLRYEDSLVASSWKVGSVELLAAGKQSAIFGIHPDTQSPFTWPQQSLRYSQKDHIPIVSLVQLEALRSLLTDTADVTQQENSPLTGSCDHIPAVGERNLYLFREGREMAHNSQNKEELLTALYALNSNFSIPLSLGEVKQIASSIWRYKQSGNLWKRGRDAPTVIPMKRTVGADIVGKLTLHACKLYMMLVMTRHTQREFSIPQKKTAEHLGWGVQTVSDVIQELKEFGLLIDDGRTKGGSGKWRATKLYRFGSGEL